MYTLQHNRKLKCIELRLRAPIFYEEYKQAWLEALDMIEQNNVERFLIDARRHRAISLESKMWFQEEFLRLAETKLSSKVRAARVASKDVYQESLVQDIVKYIDKQQLSFKLELFDEYMEAMDWLHLGI